MTNKERVELRNKLAGLTGWKFIKPDKKTTKMFVPYWEKQTDAGPIKDCHPYQYGNITRLFDAWPEGVEMTICIKPDGCLVYATASNGSQVKVQEDTRYDALLRATVSVLEGNAAGNNKE